MKPRFDIDKKNLLYDHPKKSASGSILGNPPDHCPFLVSKTPRQTWVIAKLQRAHRQESYRSCMKNQQILMVNHHVMKVDKLNRSKTYRTIIKTSKRFAYITFFLLLVFLRVWVAIFLLFFLFVFLLLLVLWDFWSGRGFWHPTFEVGWRWKRCLLRRPGFLWNFWNFQGPLLWRAGDFHRGAVNLQRGADRFQRGALWTRCFGRWWCHGC